MKRGSASGLRPRIWSHLLRLVTKAMSDRLLARTIHEHLLRRPILSPGGLFSFGLLDGLHVRLCRPYLREAPAGFGLERVATAFMNNPGLGKSGYHQPDPLLGGPLQSPITIVMNRFL